jgi:hypothetical protein
MGLAPVSAHEIRSENPIREDENEKVADSPPGPSPDRCVVEFARDEGEGPEKRVFQNSQKGI